MPLPLIAWAGIAVAGVAAKVVYDAVTDDSSSSSDNSAEKERLAREEVERQTEKEREKRRFNELEKGYISELRSIKREFLPEMVIPASISQSRIQTFANEEVNDFDDAVSALEELLGKSITVIEDSSEIHTLEMQIKFLDKLEQFVRQQG